jgi:hypothetical protein
MKNLDPEAQEFLKQLGEFVKFTALITICTILSLYLIYII